MKKISIITSFFCLASLALSAQKNYEYQDTRRKNESFIRLQPRPVRMDVATFALGGISESVGTTPLQKIPFTFISSDSIAFEGQGIKAWVTLAPFNKEAHRLDYDEKYLIRIDRRTYYGNYGTLPETFVSDVKMIIYGDTVAIPKLAYSDLFNVHLSYLDKGIQRSTNAIYRSLDGRYTYLYLFSKDDAGSYEVTWVFDGKKYMRRVLDYDLL